MSHRENQVDDVVPAEVADESAEGRGRPNRRWGRWVTVAGFLALVSIPLIAKQVPREVARWHLALAIERQLDGNSEAAERYLESSVRWNSEDVEAYLQRSEWRREAGDYAGALASCEQAHAVAPQDPRVFLERSQVLQQLGRWQEAIADWNTLAEQNAERERLPPELIWNGRAYARALAATELEAALEDANRAVAEDSKSTAILDTRGFIFYRLGRNAEAREDLDQAVRQSEAQLTRWRESLTKGAGGPADIRQRNRLTRQIENQVAVIIYHRSLVLAALGEETAAEADRKRVVELGYTPDEKLF